MRTTYSQYYQGDTINLDFHSIPHYGEKSEMGDNWVGAKHQRLKSALTLLDKCERDYRTDVGF